MSKPPASPRRLPRRTFLAGLCLSVLALCLYGVLSSRRGGDAAKDAPPSASSPKLTPLPPPPPPPPPRAVVIDAGHGGEDGGTSGNGMLEKEWTLKVALALAETLRGRGHVVELVRSDDTRVPLAERPAIVNAQPRVAMISIHFNAGVSEARGVETFYSWPKKPEVMARLHAMALAQNQEREPPDFENESQALAAAVQEHVVSATGSRDRGTKNRRDLAMTSRCVCPSILIECGFLSNAAESRKIRDDAWRQKLVSGIADGFEAWLRQRGSNPLDDFETLGPLVLEPGGGFDLEQEH